MKGSIGVNNNFDTDEGLSPMDNISNMSDAMLVLAVGIMLALVINWKIDINVTGEKSTQNEAVEETNMEEYEFDESNQNTEVSAEDVESNYVKSGTVYTDTVTGKTYVVID